MASCFQLYYKFIIRIRWIIYFTPHCHICSIPAIDIDFQWLGKSSTRLPEALFLSFEPLLKPQNAWRLSKLQQLINPQNVVLNGSQYQHG